MSALKKLIHASQPISSVHLSEADSIFGEIPVPLHELYSSVNGFMALEGALVVYPAQDETGSIGLFSINDLDSWKRLYSGEVLSAFFFSRDVFGGQYGVLKDNIYKLNPESGELKKHSSDINSWAEKIISDYDYETGWSLARSWQLENKLKLGVGECLIPKRPFSIGGDFEVNNLEKVTLESAMKKYGDLYRQIKDILPGEKISIRW